MKDVSPHIVLCNGAEPPEQLALSKLIKLEYQESNGNKRNVKLALPNFVLDVFHLPDRILDLLEIAAYVLCADRLTSRGSKGNLEYHSWSRLFYFTIKVRDFDFWNRHDVKEKLKEALVFMFGDRGYHFSFKPGHSTPPAGLFDKETFRITPLENTKVILFSGGLDSLAGIVERLHNSSDQLCLISHRSAQGTAKTQNQLIKALNEWYPNRIRYYKFGCSLHGTRAKEETQRTRAFLFTSIAYAMAHVLSQSEIFVYENGITSINFPKQQNQINARASRTTHPKTMSLLENLLSEIHESKLKIITPYFEKTKTDVFHVLDQFGKRDLITSTVSCTQTFKLRSQATHCGGCSQCVDRRFAAYASALDDVDEGGIYASDFIQKSVVDNEVKTTLIDYVRQAKELASLKFEDFYYQMLGELGDLIDYLPGSSEVEKIKRVWKLSKRHGEQVGRAIHRMRTIHDDPYHPLPEESFLQMIAKREYLMRSESQSNSIEIFYSYSHKDEDLRQQLENHLAILKRLAVITDWNYRKISAGREWEGEIDKHLNSAHVILLLISSDFMASDYCYDVEMQRAMERHDAGEARVIPVILRSVYWQGAPFGKLNALPTGVEPVTLWANQDAAFTDIANGIREVVQELNQT